MNKKKSDPLTIALSHEFLQCRESFRLCTSLITKLREGHDSKALRLSLFTGYLSFVANLYEFYLGCINADKRFPNDPRGEKVDRIINGEVKKLLDLRCERIIQGRAPKWENDISFYQVDVPEEFGKRFRYVRNMRSHADGRRGTVSLTEFYIKYHRFVILLYEEPLRLWDMKDVEEFDWGAIESFADAFI